MTDNGWWMLIGVPLAMALGAAAGGWFTFRTARVSFDARLRREVVELQQQQAATADQLRAERVTAETDLVQARIAFNRQLATAAQESRAAVARIEERLRVTRDDPDGERRGSPPDTATAELSDGFAATRPMRDGM